MSNKTTYRKDGNYRFAFVDGHTEAVTYLGKNKEGMYCFLFGTGEVWTGYVAPVIEE